MSASLLPGKDQHAPRTITFSTPPRPATDNQRRFISDLRNERDDTGMGDTPEDMTVETATQAIEWLLKRPKKVRAVMHLAIGLYEADDGQVYRVTEGQDSGRPYVLVLDMSQLDQVEPGDKPVWDKMPGLSYTKLCRMNPFPISEETARRLGHLHMRCMFCSRELSVKASVEAGYGPDCAEKYGLPYGDN
jgi:hypothetical protein